MIMLSFSFVVFSVLFAVGYKENSITDLFSVEATNNAQN
jgi:hypothetical protein